MPILRLGVLPGTLVFELVRFIAEGAGGAEDGGVALSDLGEWLAMEGAALTTGIGADARRGEAVGPGVGERFRGDAESLFLISLGKRSSSDLARSGRFEARSRQSRYFRLKERNEKHLPLEPPPLRDLRHLAFKDNEEGFSLGGGTVAAARGTTGGA